MVMSGPGLQALRDLYEYHDLQRQSISRSEYEKWIRTAENRTRSKAPEVRDMAEIERQQVTPEKQKQKLSGQITIAQEDFPVCAGRGGVDAAPNRPGHDPLMRKQD